jgi:hypothetical protein
MIAKLHHLTIDVHVLKRESSHLKSSIKFLAFGRDRQLTIQMQADG